MREQLELEKTLRDLLSKSAVLLEKLKSSEEKMEERVKNPLLQSFEMIQY